MYHLVESQWPRAISDLKPPTGGVLRNIPGGGGRQEFNACADLFFCLSLGTRQPILTLFFVTSDASVEQLPGRTTMP
jgi:hypothetical protein